MPLTPPLIWRYLTRGLPAETHWRQVSGSSTKTKKKTKMKTTTL